MKLTQYTVMYDTLYTVKYSVVESVQCKVCQSYDQCCVGGEGGWVEEMGEVG